MTIDEQLAKRFGLCWHSSVREWKDCKKCAGFADMIVSYEPADNNYNPDFTAQIVVDGEPQSLLAHHLRLSGELEGFLEWHYREANFHLFVSHMRESPTTGLITDYNVILLDFVSEDILLTPTLFKQAVGAYLDWKEASNGG